MSWCYRKAATMKNHYGVQRPTPEASTGRIPRCRTVPPVMPIPVRRCYAHPVNAAIRSEYLEHREA